MGTSAMSCRHCRMTFSGEVLLGSGSYGNSDRTHRMSVFIMSDEGDFMMMSRTKFLGSV